MSAILVHQTQPTNETCVQTCLAMALGVPVRDVIDVYGDRAMNTQSLQVALTECGIVWNQFVTGTLVADGWYFAVVPSLNRRGGAHQILMRFELGEGGLQVLDPARRKRYAEDGSDLRSWSYLMPFWPGGRLPKVERGAK